MLFDFIKTMGLLKMGRAMSGERDRAVLTGEASAGIRPSELLEATNPADTLALVKYNG